MNSGIVDLGQHPVIHGDDICNVVFEGDRVHIIFYEQRTVDGVLCRCISGEVIRPLASVSGVMLTHWRELYGDGRRRGAH